MWRIAGAPGCVIVEVYWQKRGWPSISGLGFLTGGLPLYQFLHRDGLLGRWYAVIAYAREMGETRTTAQSLYSIKRRHWQTPHPLHRCPLPTSHTQLPRWASRLSGTGSALGVPVRRGTWTELERPPGDSPEDGPLHAPARG